MEKSSQGTARNRRAPKEIILWDIQVAAGSRLAHVMFYGLQRGVAEMKKKGLLAGGTMKRNIWIVKHGTEPKTIVRK